MKTIVRTSFIAALSCSGAAQALDWTSDLEIRPYVTTGVMDYKYKRDTKLLPVPGAPQTSSGDETKDSLLFVGIGASAFFGNFFVDLSFQKSNEGEDDHNQSIFGVEENVFGSDLDNPFISEEVSTREFEREELSLSLGYVVTDRLGIFAGYRQNNTDFRDSGGRVESSVFRPTVPISLVTDFEFEQKGLFVGATYVWPFETDSWFNGALSIDLGVAFLDGDQRIKNTETVTINGSTNVYDFDYAGEAIGLNLGLAWAGPLTERLSYAFGVDGYDYSYEGTGESSDFTDRMFRYSLSIAYAIGMN